MRSIPGNLNTVTLLWHLLQVIRGCWQLDGHNRCVVLALLV
jgi:hypothetical protein